MDKSWMNESFRFSKKYVMGVRSFIRFAKKNMNPNDTTIRCPCIQCLNIDPQTIDDVEDHLFVKGISTGYTKWIYHGENIESSTYDGGLDEMNGDEGEFFDVSMIDEDDEDGDRVMEMLQDVRNGNFVELDQGDETNLETSDGDEEDGDFDKLLSEAQRELYPNCKKYSTLSFVIKLLHLKVMNHMSNKAVDNFLEFFKDVLPDGETVPKSTYQAKAMLRGLGLGYETIHACKNDCILFWKQHKDRQECPNCGESRWEIKNEKGKSIPHKILRYFPLKPRLKRLFMSKELAEDMRWHQEKRSNDDNKLRHPADAEAWKHFDKEHPEFASDARNVRLGLATDGFNPFGDMSSAYSMWPVILMPYNLPPWKCMKEPYFMMSLLIPGRRAPGKDIDVYLQPLIDELKELWDVGVRTIDAHSGKPFQMRAAVIWTINDFPAYSNLAQWICKGYMTCPVCNKDTGSYRLRSKICYMDHRRFLPMNHSWRKSRKFNGKQELRQKPRELTGDDILEQLSKVNFVKPGKHVENRKRKRAPEDLNWIRKSIFFELPYWRTLKLRHNLDVMHIEKNICESVLGTLLDIEGKTKDTYKARLDLQDMNIRKELHLRPRGDSYEKPIACYTLPKEDRERFCEFIKSVKFPDAYASNVSRCVKPNGKISGLKSHDCHILLQRLLPVGIRGYVLKDVYSALAELGNFFKELCCKTLEVEKLKSLEKDIALILCKLEMIYPPTFFDVMVHLAVHLPRETILGGPVQYRWMYPIERYLRTLKGYVRNKARPEGSIAEAYLMNECLNFCSMYLKGVETKFNRPERNDDGEVKDDGLSVFSQRVRLFGESTYDFLPENELEMASWYVLNNCEEIEEYLDQHMEELKKESPLNLERRQQELFPSWFEQHVSKLYSEKSEKVTDQLYALSRGPDPRVWKYPSCVANGVRYHTKERDRHHRTQNCGIVVKGDHNGQEMDFYGLVTNIIELEYLRGNRVVLFKCEWFDIENNRRKGRIQDDYFISINSKGRWYKNDPFILPVQGKQVFYLKDTKLGNDWQIVQEFQHRHVYDVPEVEKMVEDEELLNTNDVAYQENEGSTPIIVSEVDVGSLVRNDVDPEIIPQMNEEVLPGESDFIFDENGEEDDTLQEYHEDNENEMHIADDSDLD